MSNKSKNLIIITSNKMSFIALKRNIKREEWLIAWEDGTSLIKEEDNTSKESSSEEAGASDKRAPQWL
jgi:hypothetical protein